VLILYGDERVNQSAFRHPASELHQIWMNRDSMGDIDVEVVGLKADMGSHGPSGIFKGTLGCVWSPTKDPFE
jgi:hypothetical protein